MFPYRKVYWPMCLNTFPSSHKPMLQSTPIIQYSNLIKTHARSSKKAHYLPNVTFEALMIFCMSTIGAIGFDIGLECNGRNRCHWSSTNNSRCYTIISLNLLEVFKGVIKCYLHKRQWHINRFTNSKIINASTKFTLWFDQYSQTSIRVFTIAICLINWASISPFVQKQHP